MAKLIGRVELQVVSSVCIACMILTGGILVILCMLNSCLLHMRSTPSELMPKINGGGKMTLKLLLKVLSAEIVVWKAIHLSGGSWGRQNVIFP
jgi:hypothetical protein